MDQKVLSMIVQRAPMCLSLQCYAANHKSSVSVHLAAAEPGLMVTVGDRKGPLQVRLCSLHGEVLAHFSSLQLCQVVAGMCGMFFFFFPFFPFTSCAWLPILKSNLYSAAILYVKIQHYLTDFHIALAFQSALQLQIKFTHWSLHAHGPSLKKDRIPLSPLYLIISSKNIIQILRFLFLCVCVFPNSQQKYMPSLGVQ